MVLNDFSTIWLLMREIGWRRYMGAQSSVACFNVSESDLIDFCSLSGGDVHISSYYMH